MKSPKRHPRRHPAHGVLAASRTPTIVFLTVCTRGRKPWLATREVHELLRAVWGDAKAWLVFIFTCFVRPTKKARREPRPPGGPLRSAGALATQVLSPLDNWVRFWKSQFSKRDQNPQRRWQVDHWDTRLRRGDSYDGKWEYVRNNPVRAGLVVRPEDWPFGGELHDLRW